MRRGCDQYEVPVWVGSQVFDELVAQMATTALVGGKGARVGLIHDHAFRAGAHELIPPPAGFDVVGGNDDEGIQVEKRLAGRCVPLQAGDGAG